MSASDNTCHCAQLQINIKVLRNNIEFDPLPRVQVSEFEQPGFDVVTVKANGGVGSIQYSILGGDPNDRFRIDPQSGLIEVNAELDFETVQLYSIIIHALSVGTTVEGNATQEVEIGDENEPPYFKSPCANTTDGCLATIDEGDEVGRTVFRVEAEDPDLTSVPNGMLQFSILEANRVPFGVDTAGVITNTEGLDREDEDQYTFTVNVQDMGSPSLQISTKVTITVADIDDNAPVFLSFDPLSVNENSPNGFVVHQFIAVDADIGSNAEFFFSASSSEPIPFIVSTRSGVMRVSGSIDYEVATSYSLNVTAATPGGLSSTISTVVMVIDLNDNAPIFTEDPYQQNVVEHSPPGTPILAVSASDADSGSNAKVTYFIRDGNVQQLLAINSSTGVIAVAGDIDRETITQLRLLVQAQDSGSPQQLSSSAVVIIKVLDINDNAPVFDPAVYGAGVREDTRVPFTILQVFASDRDAPSTENSTITYSVAAGTDAAGTFSINETTGEFSLLQALDFELEQSYRIDVVATDGGSPALNGSAVVNIQVVNVNEDPPELSGDQTVNVSEIAPINSTVARFTALDPDMNSVVFLFSSGNSEGKFSIDAQTGTITLADLLDFETTPTYALVITASDGQQTANATLRVNVIDENEFPPVFTSTLSFQTVEEQNEGALVGTLVATDRDGSKPNSQVTYSFGLDQVLAQYLTLHPDTGELRTRSCLDREQLTGVFPPLQNSSRTAEVIARDGGTPSLQSRATITIQLLDINDNKPIFSQNLYLASLLENLPGNTSIIQLSATDADLGSNALIDFGFTEASGNEGLFSLDHTTGLLMTSQSLDCEFAADYSFNFTAMDRGTPAMTGQSKGRLEIIDENDNSPIFNQSVYAKTLSENFPVQQMVIEVSATDADKGSNGEVVYEIIGQEKVDPGENQDELATIFNIATSSGAISHITPFNYENQPLINLTLHAVDRGVPRRTGSAQLVITVENVDEAAPTFTSGCNAQVAEDLSLQEVVTQCTATDRDNVSTSATHDRAIVYSIVDATGTFGIDNVTGQVILLLELDRETRGSYEIQVVATDLVSKSTSIDVQIVILDVNDNAPSFSEPSYDIMLSDSDVVPGRNVLVEVHADDADQRLAGSVLYSIFDVDISRDSQATTIMVTATDQGTTPLNSTVTVTVTFESSCLVQRYSIGQLSGVISAALLCNVAIHPSTAAVPVGQQHSFTCVVLSNAVPSITFIRDGNRVSPETLSPHFSIAAARQEDTGDYTCIVRSTSLPSLQSPASRLTVTGQLSRIGVEATINIFHSPISSLPAQFLPLSQFRPRVLQLPWRLRVISRVMQLAFQLQRLNGCSREEWSVRALSSSLMRLLRIQWGSILAVQSTWVG